MTSEAFEQQYFTRNCSTEKFSAGDARKAELKLKAEQSKSAFSFIYFLACTRTLTQT